MHQLCVHPDFLEELLEKGGFSVRLRGSSMLPLVWPGTKVWISSCEERCCPGDLVFFLRDGKVVLHRVREVTSSYLRTQGDNRRQDDGWIAKSDIIGQVQGMVIFRFHFRHIPPAIAGVFRKVFLRVLPVIRNSFWFACRVTKPFRRALTSEYSPHSLRP
ncbi:MAG: S24/S26 family peptidase [Myxococcales bacterium]|nr:MAG: S24/S26 family peptidase [Myxococcales bacterium]